MVSDWTSERSYSRGVGVLILVLMEYGLGPCWSRNQCHILVTVLILVLMEYGLGL